LAAAEAKATWKSEGGRGFCFEELEGPGNKLPGELMDIVIVEVVVKDLTLNGAGELSQRWKVEASLGVQWVELIELGAHEFA
tara:strand:- start:31 stop:276 length:246 start_codon:yes stop_codon:yes gene_type:complete